MKLNLNQITIQVKDVAISISFYRLLGLRLIVESLPDYARFECTGGDSTFSLHRMEREEPTSNTWIYFESDALDDAVKQLLEKGVKFELMPKDQPWLWREAWLRDPDGHRIILYHAGANRKNPPWRIQ